MDSPEQIALSYVGTPFRHQGRLPRTGTDPGGLDCAGVIICVARQMKLVAPDFDVVNYAQQPDKTSIVEACDKYLVRVSRQQAQPSDVLVMRWDAWPQHLGVMGVYPSNPAHRIVIHAFMRPGETDATVRWHRLAPHLMQSIVRVYRFPESVWQP